MCHMVSRSTTCSCKPQLIDILCSCTLARRKWCEQPLKSVFYVLLPKPRCSNFAGIFDIMLSAGHFHKIIRTRCGIACDVICVNAINKIS